MTAITGADGAITTTGWSGKAAGAMGGVLRQWNATVSYVVSEITPFGASRNRRFTTGMLTVNGSATGETDDTLLPTAQTGATGVGQAPVGDILLTAQTGNTWGFYSIVSSVSLSVDKVGDNLISFDFTTGDEAGAADQFVEAWL